MLKCVKSIVLFPLWIFRGLSHFPENFLNELLCFLFIVLSSLRALLGKVSVLVASEAVILVLVNQFGGRAGFLHRRALVKFMKPPTWIIPVSIPTSPVVGEGSSSVVSSEVSPSRAVPGGVFVTEVDMFRWGCPHFEMIFVLFGLHDRERSSFSRGGGWRGVVLFFGSLQLVGGVQFLQVSTHGIKVIYH